RGGINEPHQQLQSGGLSGAVGAKESEYLIVFHCQMQRLEGFFFPFAPESYGVSLLQSEDFKRRHGGFSAIITSTGRAEMAFRQATAQLFLAATISVPPRRKAAAIGSNGKAKAAAVKPSSECMARCPIGVLPRKTSKNT